MKSEKNAKTNAIPPKLNTISHDKIFKIIASRGLKSKNENFLISRSSFNFLLFNITNLNFSQKKSNKDQTENNVQNNAPNKSSPFLTSFFITYNSKNYFFGIKATKKHFKKATTRNKIKRRIKAILLSYIKTHPIIITSNNENNQIENKQTENKQNYSSSDLPKHISHYNFVVIIPLRNILKQKFPDLKSSLFEILNKNITKNKNPFNKYSTNQTETKKILVK